LDRSKFKRRLFFIIISVVSFHILGIEALLYFVMDPSFDEFVWMLIYPLPLAVPLVAIYCLLTVYLFCRPIFKFIDAENNGDQIDEGLVKSALNRSVNLQYWLAAMSFPAYMIGGGGGAGIVAVLLGWPSPISIAVYGLLAGVIAGLLTTPTSIFASAWVTRPILRRGMEVSENQQAVSQAGTRLNLTGKFVLILFVMVTGISGYAILLGHSHTTSVLKNMEKMEKLVPLEQSEKFLDNPKSSSDTRIRSSKYFNSKMGSINIFFIGMIVVASIFTLIIGYTAALETTQPVRILKEAADKINEGDYRKPVTIISNDEFAELGTAFNMMTKGLVSELEKSQSMVSGINEAVKTLAPMSKELVTISNQQASSSLQQAAAAEQAVIASQETASVARQIAGNADEVSQSANNSLKLTEEGRAYIIQTKMKFDEINQAVQKISDATKDLGKRSEVIGGIVEIINELSNQTNLLALNALLEAAGAGEYGRRFGVVADEVQRLAKRTTESTKIIQDIITGIQSAVDESEVLVKDSDDSIKSSLEYIEKMSSMFSVIYDYNNEASNQLKEITLMTSQQSSASEQMSKTISEVKETAEQESEAAASIQESLKSLDELIISLQSHIEEGNNRI
jgi:methyl-accepting chemotaxis protein